MSFFEIIEPEFRSFVLKNAPVKQLATGFDWVEGPTWFGDANCLLFSDIPNNRIMRWTPESGISIYREPSNYSNGHTRDRQGRLVSCEHGGRRVTRTELDGSITILADRFEGKRFNSPNDVVVKSDGTIWFTDPHYGIKSNYEGFKAEQELPCQVYCIDPASGHSDGFRCDSDGNIWTSAADGVHCISPSGVLMGKIFVPELVSNVCFGGRAKHRLFITATTSIYSIILNREGAQRP